MGGGEMTTPWRRFRCHLKKGLSAAKFQEIVSRKDYAEGTLQPVHGGGRNLVIAIDVATRSEEAMEMMVDAQFLWGKPREARVKITHYEEVEA